jgi:DNA/RNA-binding domain of Phe-tRNA-synthetase-like protein
MQVSINDITVAFPDYRVAVVVAEGLRIPPERPAALDALIAEREAACRAAWGGTELSQIPGVAAWRAAYKAFGIKQTRYRSSVERLVKNVLAGRPAGRSRASTASSMPTTRCRLGPCCRSAPTTSTR